MNSRDYSIGIGVGQFMSEQNMSKPDILKFFKRLAAKDNCEETCPFAEECDKVMDLSNEEQSLCTILGIE